MIYMIYWEVYVLGEINEDEVCKKMSILNKIEDKIDEIDNLIKMEMGGINEEMDRVLDEKMDEETNNEIDEMVNLMNLINVEMDEGMSEGDVYEKTNRINNKIDIVNKIDEEIDNMVHGIKKRIKIIDEKLYGLNNIDKDDRNNKMATLCMIDDKMDEIIYLTKNMINKIDGEMDELKS